MSLDELIDSGFASIDLVEEIYSKYQKSPGSVDPSWRAAFDELDTAFPSQAQVYKGERVKTVSPPDIRIEHLIQAYRSYGHLMANINPIATQPIEEPWQLKLNYLGFEEKDLAQEFPTNGLLEEPTAPLQEIIATLQEIYCRNIGVEYMWLHDPKLEQWLRDRIETTRFKFQLSIDQKKMILQHLNKSELFEVFLHTKYVGQKRFSLEGGETMIPVLAAIIETGVNLKLEEFIIGMAHRGRLNVLSNILDKSYAQIFSEFEEGYIPLSFEGSGDVKYHKGFSSKIKTLTGQEVSVVLTPNPSHLESVNPVVEGLVRARQTLKYDKNKETVLSILIHGDAAIAGQGVVYETMQMYALEGYSTGGTIHIVINNQIGFTTLPQDNRSTLYCTDIAKAFHAPVFHVNAEDPESCVYATNLAVELRQRFHCDVFIDINCYRKYGHNEADEPAFTQPLEYQLIRQKKPIREIYRDDLINQGVLERKMAETLEEEFKTSLQEALEGTKVTKKTEAQLPKKTEIKQIESLFEPFETGVSKDILQEVAEKFCMIPEGLTVHKKLERVIQDRMKMAREEKPVDWGMGETLTYATLLVEGIDVRLSGQDSCRGTFSHRHALWMDQEQERAYYPLKHLRPNQGKFDVFNSPLSEFGVLGFEFGYSLGHPKALVIWEAQFGDFSNGAQVVIDQYISTCEMKWGQKNSLVLFLPHGYEGQGPEHSSGRIERFLALCGNNNMWVVNPTTPAQLFHLLRCHVLKPIQKPLIVFTPKGLLRYPECVNSLDDFTQGSFQEILDDPDSPNKAKTLVFCSGRVYYDLTAERKKQKVSDMAIVRVEQMYPLHTHRLTEMIEKYNGFTRCCWVQEEPKNMGGWYFIKSILRKLVPNKNVEYIGRERSAASAAGSFGLHKKEHAELIEALFGGSHESGD